MAVKIRLKKLGRTHRPFFRVCAMDARSPRDGRVIEELGTYDPMVPHTDARAILNGERIAHWMSVGAQPTPKVGTLIKKYGKDGTHLEAQAEAISQLSERRQKSIESAKKAAAAVEMPKPEPTPEPAAEGEAAEGAEAKAEGAEAKAEGAEAAAADAPAKEEAPAEAKEEKKEEAKAEEKPEAKEEKKEEPKAEAKEPKAEAKEEKADAKEEEKKEEAAE